MSEERTWRYKLIEEEQRRLRVNALRQTINGFATQIQSIVSRARTMGVEHILSQNVEFNNIRRMINRLVGESSQEDSEDTLIRIRRDIENYISTANEILNKTYEQELERQRKEEALKKAMASLESLKTTFESTQSNELVQKWESKKLAEFSNEIKEIEEMLKDKYEEIPHKCEALKSEITELCKNAEEKEHKYIEVTLVKDKIQNVLRELGFVETIIIEEKRTDSDFQGYIINAQSFAGRKVKTVIGTDGKVKDEFSDYGEECFKDAENYTKFLQEKYRVKMEDVKEVRRVKPKILIKDEKPLPGAQQFEKS